MNIKIFDKYFMNIALSLAKKGQFTTSPNPNVGCVIVLNDKIVGKGFHYKTGEAHAEINALKIAGNKANGATAYVTLEPCNHYGMTPPCTEALIKSGIKRVVIAIQDPNPQVSGHGLLKLKQAGIEISCGLLENEIEELNKGFFKRMRTGLPYVQLKLAASLDGKTSLSSGKSKWITSKESRQDVQKFRAQSSAILTTSTTVLIDNPSLNVRYEDFTFELKNIYNKNYIRQPIRIIIDNNNKITSEYFITKLDGLVWLISSNSIFKKLNNNIEQIIIPSYNKEINLFLLMLELAKRNINLIWVESGPTFAGALLKLKLVDELIIYTAPKILGKTAKGLINIPEVKDLNNAYIFKFIDFKIIGSDLRLILKLLKN